MRAYVLESFDDEPRFVDLPRPAVGERDVLVRVHAVSVNPVDLAIASGSAKAWLAYRFPVTLGRDFAGVVEDVGAAVTRFARGDRVHGYVADDVAHRGSFAEYIAFAEDAFAVKQPDGIGHEAAATLGLAAVTATMCLDAAGVRDGGTVLVSGATGGVGSFAVQIAKARGATVLATARPGEEERHVIGLGADAAVDWSADVAGAVRARAPEGCTALVDVVTADPAALAALARAVLAPGGKVATTLSAADPDRLDGYEGVNVWSAPDTAIMEQVADLVRQGKVRPPVAQVLEFDRLPEAASIIAAGAVGKLAVRVAS